ncbi:MAG: hypothetical protein ACTHOL_13640, partial [Luteibacter jiangsuensis]
MRSGERCSTDEREEENTPIHSSSPVTPGEQHMIDVRRFESLGGANHGWLDAKHHFSFASY